MDEKHKVKENPSKLMAKTHGFSRVKTRNAENASKKACRIDPFYHFTRRFTCAILHLDVGVLQLMPGYSCRGPSRLPSEGFSRRKCLRTSSLLKGRPPLTPLQRHSWERGVLLLQLKRRSFSSILSEKKSNYERELWTHFTPFTLTN